MSSSYTSTISCTTYKWNGIWKKDNFIRYCIIDICHWDAKIDRFLALLGQSGFLCYLFICLALLLSISGILPPCFMLSYVVMSAWPLTLTYRRSDQVLPCSCLTTSSVQMGPPKAGWLCTDAFDFCLNCVLLMHSVDIDWWEERLRRLDWAHHGNVRIWQQQERLQ